MVSGPLHGRTVAVTRAPEQAGELTERLEALGARVVEVPTIQIVPPEDGGAALADAADRLTAYDWVVFTSANGAARLVGALDAGPGRPAPNDWPHVAVVGSGTAEVLGAYGVPVDLVPARFVAEGLLDAFGDGPGRVLLPQAAVARPVLAEGLRARGWTVDVVTAYRTIPAVLPPELVAAAAAADAITFTSSSTVQNFLHAAGAEHLPPVVVCIGPVTAATAAERGITVAGVAAQHSLAGLVDAVVRALS
jgi:uroporphyrinogen-III synthase